MSSCSSSLDHWRSVFRSTERSISIFEIIDVSIAVAAADRPVELLRRRDGIVKSLYSFPSVAAPARPEQEAEQQQQKQQQQQQQQQQQAVISSFCCSSGRGSQKSPSEEEAVDELQDAIDDAFALLDEVPRLKKILDNKNQEDESSLFDSLRSLQLMELTVSTLTATEIENSVRGVEGHGSSRVRQLARALLDGWAELRHDSSNVSDAVVADAPDNAAANSSDDPWANFPPLDEGALRAINGPPIDLDELFSENPRKTRKVIKRDGVERAVDDRSETPSRSAGPRNAPTERGRRTMINASSKTSGKDLKRYLERCAAESTMKKDGRAAKMTPQQCPMYTNDSLVDAKLEASRMRIREGYDRAKDEKKRRRIQLLDLHDVPKPVGCSMRACESNARRRRRGFNNW